MNIQDVLDPKSWAERTCGRVHLHDMRRTRRTVQAATNLAENALGSLPAHMHTWNETKALYRRLPEPDVTCAALLEPQLQQTRDQAKSSPVVLLVQETRCHRSVPSSQDQLRSDTSATNADVGFSCKRCLPCARRHARCSCAWTSEPGCRAFGASEGERRYQRRKRQERETDVWMRQVHSLGTAEPGSMWVHVGDPRAAMFPFFHAGLATRTHFLVRAAQHRRLEHGEEEMAYSLERARSWPSQASRALEIRARHGHKARSTNVPLSLGQVTLWPPRARAA